MKRPTSLTVVSILLMVLGGLGFLGAFNTLQMKDDPVFLEMMEKMGADNAIPISVQIAMSFVGALVVLVSGIAIYKGQGWARWLYIGWTLLGVVIGLVTAPAMFVMTIPGLVFTAIIAFFLFRPAANAYFRGDDPTDAPSA